MITAGKKKEEKKRKERGNPRGNELPGKYRRNRENTDAGQRRDNKGKEKRGGKKKEDRQKKEGALPP